MKRLLLTALLLACTAGTASANNGLGFGIGIGLNFSFSPTSGQSGQSAQGGSCWGRQCLQPQGWSPCYQQPQMYNGCSSCGWDPYGYGGYGAYGSQGYPWMGQGQTAPPPAASGSEKKVEKKTGLAPLPQVAPLED